MMEMGTIGKGTILSDNSNFDGRLWVIGSFIGVSGTAENYEAALYDGSVPAEYPLVVKIVPRGNGPLPVEFQFYLDNADPIDIDLWKRTRRIDYLGMPSLLGSGIHVITGQNFYFIVLERHGKDLWSLFSERGRKFEEHTVYKIALQILSTLKYMHTRSYVHGDIRASNIVVDVATQNQIYLVNYRFASRCTADDGQVNLNHTRDDAVKYMSRDAYRGVLTKRGDVETLFYNIVEWLGLHFPWEENSEDSSLVRKQKKHAFANVEQFLMDWSKKNVIPSVVAEYMKLLAPLNDNKRPIYGKFMKVLDIGLKNIYHVRTGYLEFSISNSRVDDRIEEDPVQVNERRYNPTKTHIWKIRISVEKLARIISENCRHEGEVKLRDTGPYSLIQAIYILMGKKTHAWQNRLADAWETDEAALKTITKQFWASKAKGIARNAEALKETNAYEEPNESPSTSDQTNTNEPNCNIVGRSISKSHFDAISPNEAPSQEDQAASDLGNTSSPNMLRTLLEARSFTPLKSDEVQSPTLSRPSNRGFRRSHSSLESISEVFPPFQKSDQLLDKVHHQFAIETDSSVELPSNCRKSTSVYDEQWPSTYEWLETWLEMKEQILKAFGSIPLDSRLVTGQVQQVRVLLDDFRSQMPRMCQLTSVLAKQPSDSVDAQKLNEILQRWRKQVDWLENRGRKLGDASLGQAREALRDVSSNLDKLIDQKPEEQLMRKMEILAGQLEAHQRALLASAETVIEQLWQAFRDADFNAELRNELRSVHDLYDNLQLRIDVEKSAIEKSLNDERQFDDSCKKIIVWLAKELDTSEKLVVAADIEELQQLREHHQNVMSKEIEVNELLAKGREFLSRQQNIEISTLQKSLLDLMEFQWDRLKSHSLHISSRVQTCVDLHDKYQMKKKLFLSWLPRVEDEFRHLQPTTLNDIEIVLKDLVPLNNDVREKLAEFDENVKLGEAFIGACDVDSDVKNELSLVKERWDRLNNDLRKRIQSLEDLSCRFNVFNEYFKKLERRVDELKLHDTVREITDPNQVDSTKGMREDVDSLSKPLEVVCQLADELKLKASEQGIDVSRLSSEVDRMTARIESLKTKLSDSLANIYEQKLASLERDVKPKIEDVKPNISLPKINWNPGEIVDLSSDDEDEIDEKPKDLPLNANTFVSGELIDLASDSDSEFDLSTQQLGELLEGPEPAIHTCENQPGEALKDVEQVSKVGKSLEKRKRTVSESHDGEYEETGDGEKQGSRISDSKISFMRMQGLRLKIQKKSRHKRI